MRFNVLALAASALVFAACGGKDNKGTDTAAAAAGTDTAAATTANAGTTAAATGTAAPITGTTHEVKMVGDEKGYRFEPADITVKQGDGIKFIMVSGGPHNAAFDPNDIPDDVEGQLSANMPNQMSPLNGPLLMNPNETYTISFANIKPGKYPFHCTPHLAMGMKGTITVQ